MSKKFLLATNFVLDPDHKLAKDFEKYMGMPMDIMYEDSAIHKEYNVLQRHLTYFNLAWKAFFNRNKYDYIIFWTQFVGLYYGLISRMLFFLPAHSVSIILALMYVKRSGFKGSLYHRVFKYMLDTKANNLAVCSATSERDHIHNVLKPKKIKIVSVKYGEGEIENIPEPSSDDRYFFSGGGSLRDYETLIKAFSKLKYKLKIACNPGHVKNIEIPPNVEVIFDAYGDDFDRLIQESYAVLVILQETWASAGQLVIIKSMKKGKAIIATRGNNVAEYVDPSYAFTVDPYSDKDIISAVEKLYTDRDLNKKMGHKALEEYKNNFTEEKYVARVCSVLKSYRE